MVDGGRKPAGRKQLEEWLGMSKQHVSFHIVAFKEADWLREDDAGRIYPNPYPKPEPLSAEEVDPVQVFPGLPTRDEFRAAKDPAFATDKADLLEKWNDLRKRDRDLDNAYDALVAEVAAKSAPVNGTDDAGAETGQPYKSKTAAVQATKSEPHPYMSSKKERKEVGECISVTEEAITKVRAALTHFFSLPLPDTDPIPRELIAIAQAHNLPYELLGWWMEDKAKQKKKTGYKITSAGAVRDWCKTELASWIEHQNPEMIEMARKERASLPHETHSGKTHTAG
jgi:hypothetical protein